MKSNAILDATGRSGGCRIRPYGDGGGRRQLRSARLCERKALCGACPQLSISFEGGGYLTIDFVSRPKNTPKTLMI